MSDDIKVRIAVVVCADGSWNSSGWSGGTDPEKMGLAGECVDQFPQSEYWVEAIIKRPTQAVIEAEVSPPPGESE